MALGNGNLDGPGTDADGLGHGAGAQGADQDGTEGGPSADYGGQGEFDGLGFGSSTDTDAIGTDANPTESPNYDAYDNPETETHGPTFTGMTSPMSTQESNLSKSKSAKSAGYKGPGKRGFSPLGYDRHEDNTISIKESTVKDFVDRVRTIRNPREKERAIKAFMEKHRMGLRQLSVKNAQDTDLGLFGMLPGVGILNMSRNLMMGLFEKMGLTPGVNTPAMDALEQEARNLGLLDKEATEPTEGQLMQLCNNTPGYQWNTETKTCEKVESSDV
tara:strand:+ start:12865 stop:13686 length:822 start_codon:yes stop_codon:yes gene_type:complete